jgi:hypothetical protein
MGIIGHLNLGLRTKNTKTPDAKTARQNARWTPRVSSGQFSKKGALANNPLELHKTAATATNK